jgi:hypothetical protein
LETYPTPLPPAKQRKKNAYGGDVRITDLGQRLGHNVTDLLDHLGDLSLSAVAGDVLLDFGQDKVADGALQGALHLLHIVVGHRGRKCAQRKTGQNCQKQNRLELHGGNTSRDGQLEKLARVVRRETEILAAGRRFIVHASHLRKKQLFEPTHNCERNFQSGLNNSTQIPLESADEISILAPSRPMLSVQNEGGKLAKFSAL